MAELVRPDIRYRTSFMAALDEFGPGDQSMVFERRLARSDFEGYVRTVAAWEEGREIPPGWVAVSTFWLVDGDEYIGGTNVRHKLNDYLRDYGGHIGYTIRPSRRREGHGTEVCRLALLEAKKLGLERVLITCDDDNPGSRLIIERNGGVLENVVPQPDRNVPKRRYWIDV
jgi:predicted acetyltransferase